VLTHFSDDWHTTLDDGQSVCFRNCFGRGYDGYPAFRIGNDGYSIVPKTTATTGRKNPPHAFVTNAATLLTWALVIFVVVPFAVL
jgi:hypothetical protein